MNKIILFFLVSFGLNGCASTGVPYLHSDPVKNNQTGVIVLHTSSGLDSGEFDYARFLKSRGFAVAIVDYHAEGGTDNIGKAHDELVKLKVNPDKIAIVGFSRGAHTGINISSLSNKFDNRKYNAVVSFYIGPIIGSNSEFLPPVLFLHGDQDVYVNTTQIENFCDVQKRVYKRICDYEIFKDTKHSFDRLRSRYNGYDSRVTQISYEKSVEFLNKNLK